jgi:hypothetical protein
MPNNRPKRPFTFHVHKPGSDRIKPVLGMRRLELTGKIEDLLKLKKNRSKLKQSILFIKGIN